MKKVEQREKNKKLTDNPLYIYITKKRLSVQEFALICGVGLQMVYRVMKGQCAIRAISLVKITGKTQGEINLQQFREYEAKHNIHRAYTNPLEGSCRIWKKKLRPKSKRKARVSSSD